MCLHPVRQPLRIAGRLAAALLGLLAVSPAAAGPAPGADSTLTSRFGILVQTDSQGELRPCKCPGKPINSLSRRNGVFNMARSFRYPVIVLDGGDFIPDPDDPLAAPLRDLMIEAMSDMKYDAVALGELDLLSGPEFLRRAAAALPLVCGNLQIDPGLGVTVPPVRWIDAAGKKVAVTAVLDPLLFYPAPGAFDLYGDDLVLRDMEESLGEVVASVRPKADMVVVLAHASLDAIDRLLDAVPGIDVVVQGHDPQLPNPGKKYKGAFLVVPEPHSREVAQLILSFDPPKPLAIETSRVWDLKRTRMEDRRLDELVRAFESRYGTP